MANRFIIEVRTKGFTSAHKDLDSLNTQSRAFVKNSNRSRSATAKLRSSFSALRNNLLLLTFAFGGLVIAVNKAVEAYRKQIEAETRLRASLRNVATASKDGADKLINLAAALQKVTTFGDEQIIAGMAMLATFQLNEDAIAALTPRMLDMAAAMGTGGDGLTTIALQLGKAFTGQVGALSRSGVLIDQMALKTARAAGATEEFAFLVGELDKNFKGLARELAATTVGQIDQLENEISDLNETLGKTSLPASLATTKLKKFFVEGISVTVMAIQHFTKNLDMNRDLLAQWTVSLGIAGAELAALGKTNEDADLGVDPQVVRDLQKEIDLIREKTKLQKLLNEVVTVGLISQMVTADKNDEAEIARIAKQDEFTRKRVAIFEEVLAQQSIIDATRAAGLEATIGQEAKLVELKIKQIQLEELLKNAKMKAVSSLLGATGSLFAQNKALATASARLSQAEAIINAYAAYNLALKSVPPPFGAIAGAAALIQGLANVSVIENQLKTMQSAKHGADFVTSGPQMMMVGEGSGPEHVQVTPLVDSNIDGPQGGGVTINISGGIVQDDYVRNTLVPALNKANSMGS